eukprot:7209906-Prymnesium_polylepis.1
MVLAFKFCLKNRCKNAIFSRLGARLPPAAPAAGSETVQTVVTPKQAYQQIRAVSCNVEKKRDLGKRRVAVVERVAFVCAQPPSWWRSSVHNLRDQMAPPYKDAMPATALVVSAVFNGYFITEALFEFEADLYASSDASHYSFVASYYDWKRSRPFSGTFMLVLGCLLPFVLFGMVRDAMQSLFRWRRASLVRHTNMSHGYCARQVVDVLTAATLLGVILPASAKFAMPAEAAVIEACSPDKRGNVAPACADRVSALALLHGRMLVVKVLMFVYDVSYCDSNRPPPAAAHSYKWFCRVFMGAGCEVQHHRRWREAGLRAFDEGGWRERAVPQQCGRVRLGCAAHENEKRTKCHTPPG